MLEIISSLAVLENKNIEDVIEVARIKREKRGGFNYKIFLEKRCVNVCRLEINSYLCTPKSSNISITALF